MSSEDYNDDQLVDDAIAALAIKDADGADKAWKEMVYTVREKYKKDERAVAAELQRLSKVVEARSTADDAHSFKQRTCQALMMLSMEERHKNRAPLAPKPSAPALPFKNIEYILVASSKFEEDLTYFLSSLGAELVWKKARGASSYALLRCASATTTMLIQHSASFTEPAYSVESVDATAAALKQKGIEPFETIQLLVGKAHRYRLPSGNSFSLCPILI